MASAAPYRPRITDPLNAANAAAKELPNLSIHSVTEIFNEAVRNGDIEKGMEALTQMQFYKKSMATIFFTKLFVSVCKEKMNNSLELEKDTSDINIRKHEILNHLAARLCANFILDKDPIMGDDKTPLMYACMANFDHSFFTLILRGFDPRKKDNAGNTALDLCDGSFPHMQAALRSRDPISYAACVDIHDIITGNLKDTVVNLLPRADLTIPNSDGYTPLLSACKVGRTNIALEIIRRSSHLNLNAINATNGDTALILAAQTNNIKVVDELIRKGVRLNIRNTHQFDALIYAIYQKNPTIALMLIAAGADLRPAVRHFSDSDNNLSLNEDIRIIFMGGGDAKASALALLSGKYKPPAPAPAAAAAAAAAADADADNVSNAEGGRRRSRGRKQARKSRRSRKVAFTSPVAS